MLNNYSNFTIKILFSLMLCLGLSSCAMQKSQDLPEPISYNEQEAKELWQEFLSKKTNISPYNMSGSIRFGHQDKTNRANFILWSNGNIPLRFDIMAGIGQTFAKIEENDQALILYLAQENKALLYPKEQGLNAIVPKDLPIPLSFANVSQLLRGNFSLALEDIELIEISNKNSDLFYHFNHQNYAGKIKLNHLANPIFISINDLLEISLDYSPNNLPRKISLTSDQENYKLIIIVKENKEVLAYQDEQLKLSMPKETLIIYN